jgi:hypothetical protein
MPSAPLILVVEDDYDVLADRHRPTPDELAAALNAVEPNRGAQKAPL